MQGEFHSPSLFAFGDFALVLAAHKRASNEHMIATA
jgi:hypothetical protein